MASNDEGWSISRLARAFGRSESVVRVWLMYDYEGFRMTSDMDRSVLGEDIEQLAIGENTGEFSANEGGVIEALLGNAVARVRECAHEEALAFAEAAACYDSLRPDASYLTASLLRRRKARERSEQLLRQVLRSCPMHWLAAFELALLLERSGDVEHALGMYYQALEGLDAHDGSSLFEYDSVSELFPSDSVHAEAVRGFVEASIARLEV